MRKPFVVPNVVAFPLHFSLAGCYVELEEEDQLPEVGVDAEPRLMPEYDVRQTEEGHLPVMGVNVGSGDRLEIDVEMLQVDVNRDTMEIPAPDLYIGALGGASRAVSPRGASTSRGGGNGVAAEHAGMTGNITEGAVMRRMDKRMIMLGRGLEQRCAADTASAHRCDDSARHSIVR